MTPTKVTKTIDRMDTIEQKIDRMTETSRAIEKLTAEYDEATEPVLYDQAMIPHIYDVYVSLFGGRHAEGASKKYFTFVAVVLYSPKSILDAPLTKGLRQAIADTLEYSSASAVSNNLSEAIGWYRLIKSERKSMILECAGVLNRLREEGLV